MENCRVVGGVVVKACDVTFFIVPKQFAMKRFLAEHERKFIGSYNILEVLVDVSFKDETDRH